MLEVGPSRKLVTQFDPHDKTVVLQRFERSVHCRRIDRWVVLKYMFSDLIDGLMTVLGAQHLQH